MDDEIKLTKTAHIKTLSARAIKDVLNSESLHDAANNGSDLAVKSDISDIVTQFSLVDESLKPLTGIRYEIRTFDNVLFFGKTDKQGKTEILQGYTASECVITFFN